jgi:hypothetical protein
MSRAMLIGIIIVLASFIGFVALENLGVVDVPLINLLADGSDEFDVDLDDEGGDEEGDEEYQADEEAIETTPSRRPSARRRAKRPSKKKPDAKAPAPVKPAKKKPRITLPSAGEINAPKLPSEVSLDDIAKAIARSSDYMKRCLKDSRSKGEKLEGRLLIHMTVDSWGKVTEMHLKSPKFDRTVLGRCVLRRVKGIRLPSFTGDPISVVYPVMVEAGD